MLSLLPLVEVFLPEIEGIALDKWETIGLPKVTALAKSVPTGSGQEELLILVDAMDKIAKFEATRKL